MGAKPHLRRETGGKAPLKKGDWGQSPQLRVNAGDLIEVG